jgi:asparagine synthase (glutamine-hydrolysing)
MAASLEERVLFLDHKLVESAARIPTELLVCSSRTKALPKRALERVLPREILYRRKAGFAVPVSAWSREPLNPNFRFGLYF